MRTVVAALHLSLIKLNAQFTYELQIEEASSAAAVAVADWGKLIAGYAALCCS